MLFHLAEHKVYLWAILCFIKLMEITSVQRKKENTNYQIEGGNNVNG